MDRFGTERACAEYLAAVRCPRSFACPRCAGAEARTTARGALFRKACRRQASPTAGTVLRKSRAPLRGRFLAIRLACARKTGPNAAGLQRELGPGSCRAARLPLQELRPAMARPGRERLQGEVEADEAHAGGAEEGVSGREPAEKRLVAVAAEPEGNGAGRIRLRRVPDASGASLAGLAADCVEPGSLVHADGWSGDRSLERRGYRHQATVARGSGDVAGAAFPQVHWVLSLLKRWLPAAHHGKVGAKHLQLYLDELTCRFNRRRSRHAGRIFYRLLEQLVLQRAATYQELIDRPEQPD